MEIAKSLAPVIGVLLASLAGLTFLITPYMFKAKAENVAMAVEFNCHAAAAWIALDKGLFKDEGLNITTIETFATGLELAAALTRGDIGVAWACLGPAIMAYARGVPIVIVAQTHLHGYAIVVRPGLTSINQLNGSVVACSGKGSSTYLLLKLAFEKYRLEPKEIRQMKPSEAVNALITCQIDAASLPEHYVTLAAEHGNCTVLLRSQDIWPEMPGSVLVVRRELLERSPELVSKLIRATVKATLMINGNLVGSAAVVANRLGISLEDTYESMSWLSYQNEIDMDSFQRYVDLMVKYGVLEKSLYIREIIDSTLLSQALGCRG